MLGQDRQRDCSSLLTLWVGGRFGLDSGAGLLSLAGKVCGVGGGWGWGEAEGGVVCKEC